MRCARPADTALTANSCPADMIAPSSFSATVRLSLSEISRPALLSFILLVPVARFDLSSSVCICTDDFEVGGRG